MLRLLSLTILASCTSSLSSPAYSSVNLLIGNGGDTPNTSGGTIPSTAPPFAMTRWVAQTHQNYVSRTPYNYTARTIHGFQATRQPAIWMGESAPVIIVPAVSSDAQLRVKSNFQDRGLKMRKETEVITPAYYSVVLEDNLGGEIRVEQSASSRVGHFRFTFTTVHTPYIFIESSRPSVVTSDPSNITHPTGSVSLHLNDTPARGVHEICGWNTERQDEIITPVSIADNAKKFKGYFCARFDYAAATTAAGGEYGVVQNGKTFPGVLERTGPVVGAYTAFRNARVVTVRIGTSFISIDQARHNIDTEVPDGTSLEQTTDRTKQEWVRELDRFVIEDDEDGNDEVRMKKSIFWTAVVRTLQFPSEQHEPVPDRSGQHYFSGYTGAVHRGTSYTGYSIWDIYRAQWAWLILFGAPGRIPEMVQSMLEDYKQGGWLPMWKNVVETNIMIATHADSLIAEAVVKGVRGFDLELAWEAVWKDASVPPVGDGWISYEDRQENVDFEVRAGLTSVYAEKGWVADDVHSESASRTLGYAYDDYAASQFASALGKPENTTRFLTDRAFHAPFTLFDDSTGFMRARNKDGTWADEDRGWTEGDKWAYTFDVVHAVPELIRRRGGPRAFVESLDDHFEGGHNEHSNEPSHHIPYLYAMAGELYKTQEKVRQIAMENYGDGPEGLSGNEDCGQMSAWYLFSAMGFYPVNPASGEYIVGSPLFEKLAFELSPLPGSGSDNAQRKRTLVIRAPGAHQSPYVKSVTVNGRKKSMPVIGHEEIVEGGEVVFEMSAVPVREWEGSEEEMDEDEGILGHDEL